MLVEVVVDIIIPQALDHLVDLVVVALEEELQIYLEFLQLLLPVAVVVADGMPTAQLLYFFPVVPVVPVS
jgi:hypothetical protein